MIPLVRPVVRPDLMTFMPSLGASTPLIGSHSKTSRVSLRAPVKLANAASASTSRRHRFNLATSSDGLPPSNLPGCKIDSPTSQAELPQSTCQLLKMQTWQSSRSHTIAPNVPALTRALATLTPAMSRLTRPLRLTASASMTSGPSGGWLCAGAYSASSTSMSNAPIFSGAPPLRLNASCLLISSRCFLRLRCTRMARSSVILPPLIL